MQLRIRVHANSLLDYPGRSEKELSERRALEVEDVGSNNLFCRHSSRTENYTHGVGERAARRGNARERREKKERDKKIETRVCEYGIIIQPTIGHCCHANH